MKALIFILLLLSFSFAQLKVVVTYPWIGELVREIGKDKVNLHVIAKGTEDPHFVVPKPSHIAKMRNADLLIIQGASLEIGFLPPLLQQSNNPRIQPGRQGFLDLSQFVELIEKPQRVSREMGDVHPEGNPHYNLDPHNIPVLAKAIAERMCQLDLSNCSLYKTNLEDFLQRFKNKLKEWDESLEKLKGIKVVQYHKLYDYLLQRYGLVSLGTIEPLPGIPPTAKYVEELIKKAQGVRFVLQDVYHEKRTSQYVAQRLGAKLVVLPHDVGAVSEVKDLFSLFDEIVQRLNQ
ncbi:metal ABC transporter solute-binding protein, Zn/Mn family [Thermocrinis sp.]